MTVASAGTHRHRVSVPRRRRWRTESAVLALVAAGLAAVAGFGAAPAAAASVVQGMDVSSYQANMSWTNAHANGARFAYVKATEGLHYKNPQFARQYRRSHIVGMIRGAYHFALPNRSSAKHQADYFLDNGGGWATGTKTLPGALDIEWNPYGAACYGLTHAQMNAWIRAFSDRYHQRTGRNPVIYTATSWWAQCTGNAARFAKTNPLWIARYASRVGTLPHGWRSYTFWQFAAAGRFPGDQNRFEGTLAQLTAFANG